MRARRSVVGVLGAALVLGSAVRIGAVTPAAAASPCPAGDEAVTQVHYAIFDSGSTSHNATHLKRQVDRGDEVHVLFNVPALPAGCSDVTLSLVSYQSNSSLRDNDDLVVFDAASGTFLPGGGYELQVNIVPDTGAKHFQIDFATGPVMTHPDYDGNLIDSASH